MAKPTGKIRKITARYSRQLEQMGIRVDRMLLFASHATSRNGPHSDIDLVVVSADFRRIPRIRRLETLGRAAARILQPIEAYGLSPEEAESPQPGTLLDDILARAVPIS